MAGVVLGAAGTGDLGRMPVTCGKCLRMVKAGQGTPRLRPVDDQMVLPGCEQLAA